MRNTLLAIACCLLLGACSSTAEKPKADLHHSQIPVPASYPLSSQQLMQAAHHWDVFAERTARGAAQAYSVFFPDSSVSVYVAPGGTTPFAKALHQLLTTQLIHHGVPLAAGPEGNIIADFESMIIHHRRQLAQTEQGFRHTVEPDFIQQKNDKGRYPKVPFVTEDSARYAKEAQETEMLVTCTFTHQGAILFRDTEIFYVNPSELQHYRPAKESGPLPLKHYRLQE